MKQQYTVLQVLRVKMHPDKTFIGKVRKGFDFLGFHLTPKGVTVSDPARSRHEQKVARLYEQGASSKRIRVYRLRWLVWATLATITTSAHGIGSSGVYQDNYYSSCITSDGRFINTCAKRIMYHIDSGPVLIRHDMSNTMGACRTFPGSAIDDGLDSAAYSGMVDSGGTTLLSGLTTGDASTSVAPRSSNNGLSSTPTLCLRKETSDRDIPVPANSYRATVFPPVLGSDDTTPMTPQLTPDGPIEVQCDGTLSYAQCYEKARVAYNYSSCNNGGVGSCGHTTLSAEDSLSSTLEVAKNYTAGTVIPVQLSVSTNAGTEAAATTVTVTATAAAAVVGDQTITVGVSGTDITDGDYSLSSSTITIQGGATTGTTTFTVLDDATVESTETAMLTLSKPSSGIGLGDTTTADVTITDNDQSNTTTTTTSNSGSGSISTLGLMFGGALLGLAAYRRRSQLKSART